MSSPNKSFPEDSDQGRANREFNIRDFGAVGDGLAPDHLAIQRAINAAAALGRGARVIVPGGYRFLTGSFILRGGIDFHLADDAQLVASTNSADYDQRLPTDGEINPAHHSLSLIRAEGGADLRISGTGSIVGRSMEFMSHRLDDWWIPKSWRPRLLLLSGIKGLQITGIRIVDSPSWTLHLMGCEDVLVDGITIENREDVPNCDGIDPDHCRNVVIRNCTVSCGDDPIVIKTSRTGVQHGPTRGVRVLDCVLSSRSAALKIGSESVQDISDIVFERCRIRASSRALCIQLRDEGNISNVVFRDIDFTSSLSSDAWWGLGEAISFTAIPRTPATAVGRLSGVRVCNVRGRAENSVRIAGSAESRISDIVLEDTVVTLDRWTSRPGGRWDNRPTSVGPELEPSRTPAYSIRFADNVTLRNCSALWGERRPDYFSNALQANNVTGLSLPGFIGAAAHPERDPALAID